MSGLCSLLFTHLASNQLQRTLFKCLSSQSTKEQRKILWTAVICWAWQLKHFIKNGVEGENAFFLSKGVFQCQTKNDAVKSGNSWKTNSCSFSDLLSWKEMVAVLHVGTVWCSRRLQLMLSSKFEWFAWWNYVDITISLFGECFFSFCHELLNDVFLFICVCFLRSRIFWSFVSLSCQRFTDINVGCNFLSKLDQRRSVLFSLGSAIRILLSPIILEYSWDDPTYEHALLVPQHSRGQLGVWKHCDSGASFQYSNVFQSGIHWDSPVVMHSTSRSYSFVKHVWDCLAASFLLTWCMCYYWIYRFTRVTFTGSNSAVSNSSFWTLMVMDSMKSFSM